MGEPQPSSVSSPVGPVDDKFPNSLSSRSLHFDSCEPQTKPATVSCYPEVDNPTSLEKSFLTSTSSSTKSELSVATGCVDLTYPTGKEGENVPTGTQVMTINSKFHSPNIIAESLPNGFINKNEFPVTLSEAGPSNETLFKSPLIEVSASSAPGDYTLATVNIDSSLATGCISEISQLAPAKDKIPCSRSSMLPGNKSVQSRSTLRRGAPSNPPTATHFCKLCGKQYCHGASLSKHVRKHESGALASKKFRCSYCSYSSQYNRNVMKHIETTHRNLHNLHPSLVRFTKTNHIVRGDVMHMSADSEWHSRSVITDAVNGTTLPDDSIPVTHHQCSQFGASRRVQLRNAPDVTSGPPNLPPKMDSNLGSKLAQHQESRLQQRLPENTMQCDKGGTIQKLRDPDAINNAIYSERFSEKQPPGAHTSPLEMRILASKRQQDLYPIDDPLNKCAKNVRYSSLDSDVYRFPCSQFGSSPRCEQQHLSSNGRNGSIYTTYAEYPHSTAAEHSHHRIDASNNLFPANVLSPQVPANDNAAVTRQQAQFSIIRTTPQVLKEKQKHQAGVSAVEQLLCTSEVLPDEFHTEESNKWTNGKTEAFESGPDFFRTLTTDRNERTLGNFRRGNDVDNRQELTSEADAFFSDLEEILAREVTLFDRSTPPVSNSDCAQYMEAKSGNVLNQSSPHCVNGKSFNTGSMMSGDSGLESWSSSSSCSAGNGGANWGAPDLASHFKSSPAAMTPQSFNGMAVGAHDSTRFNVCDQSSNLDHSAEDPPSSHRLGETDHPLRYAADDQYFPAQPIPLNAHYSELEGRKIRMREEGASDESNVLHMDGTFPPFGTPHQTCYSKSGFFAPRLPPTNLGESIHHSNSQPYCDTSLTQRSFFPPTRSTVPHYYGVNDLYPTDMYGKAESEALSSTGFPPTADTFPCGTFDYTAYCTSTGDNKAFCTRRSDDEFLKNSVKSSFNRHQGQKIPSQSPQSFIQAPMQSGLRHGNQIGFVGSQILKHSDVDLTAFSPASTTQPYPKVEWFTNRADGTAFPRVHPPIPDVNPTDHRFSTAQFNQWTMNSRYSSSYAQPEAKQIYVPRDSVNKYPLADHIRSQNSNQRTSADPAIPGYHSTGFPSVEQDVTINAPVFDTVPHEPLQNYPSSNPLFHEICPIISQQNIIPVTSQAVRYNQPTTTGPWEFTYSDYCTTTCSAPLAYRGNRLPINGTDNTNGALGHPHHDPSCTVDFSPHPNGVGPSYGLSTNQETPLAPNSDGSIYH